MGKRGKYQKKDSSTSSKRPQLKITPEDMDDEVDAFMKQRDIVPLDVDRDVGSSDEDNELPVFDLEDDEDEDDDDDEEDDEEEEDEDADDKDAGSKYAAKLEKQQKYLRAKYGGIEDEMHNDEDDDGQDVENKKVTWGRMKGQYYNADNVDFELQSSDNESLAEEEEEVRRLQKEAAESLTMEDMGLEDDSKEDSDSDRELTLEEFSVKGKKATKSLVGKDSSESMAPTIEEVQKDLNSLSKKEQMEVVYSSAPELVGLLSELKDAHEQLEKKINPLLSMLSRGGEIALDGGMRYLEVKQLLLLEYCKAITFYLLLKSEGESVRDHPVIARLVEIKSLLDKTRELDDNLPSELEEILKEHIGAELVNEAVKDDAPLASVSVMKDNCASIVPTEDHGVILTEPESLKEHKNKGEKRKHQREKVGLQSTEMLEVRAALEEKLKRKGVLGSLAPKPNKIRKHAKSVNGLETFDDYDDDVEAGVPALNNDKPSSLRSNKLSQLVAAKKKPKIISGDDDLPNRDDIGERRRKYELRILAGAGVQSEDGAGDEEASLASDEDPDMEEVSDEGGSEGSEDEFYKQVKQTRDSKLAAKAAKYTRTSIMPSVPQTESGDGKRHISYQIEKNRGLTRRRNKDLKNPRKKYRKKHESQVKRRKGQVQEIRKPTSSYAGETTGINARISRSVRFNN